MDGTLTLTTDMKLVLGLVALTMALFMFERVRADLVAQGFRVILDASADKLGAKIRNARLMRHPYIAVIGDEEAQTATLSVRSRDAGELGKLSVTEFAARLREESKPPKVAH